LVIGVVQKLQFLNNFHIKIAFFQGFSLKKRRTCEGTDRVPEQVLQQAMFIANIGHGSE
jgi:uncharacterized membrane protein